MGDEFHVILLVVDLDLSHSLVDLFQLLNEFAWIGGGFFESHVGELLSQIDVRVDLLWFVLLLQGVPSLECVVIFISCNDVECLVLACQDEV